MHHRAFYLCTSTPADSLDLKPVLNVFEMPGKSSQEALGYSKCFKYWYCLHVPAHCRLTGFLNTCASLHRSFDWKETGKDLVLHLGMGGSRCRCPPRGLQWIFYVWCVYVCGVFVCGLQEGAACVHLAYCIIKAQKLGHRKRKRSLGEEPLAVGGVKGETKKWLWLEQKREHAQYYSGGNSRWYRRLEKQSSSSVWYYIHQGRLKNWSNPFSANC